MHFVSLNLAQKKFQFKFGNLKLYICIKFYFFWRDIAGEQRFGTMTKTYFRGSNVAMIMFDLTNIVSWEDVDVWMKEICDNLNLNEKIRIPIILIGNKFDKINEDNPQCVSDNEINEYVKSNPLISKLYKNSKFK